MRHLWTAAIFFFSLASGCTLLRKDSGDDEMQKMSESVLKHKEGIEIDFKPVPQQKVK